MEAEVREWDTFRDGPRPSATEILERLRIPRSARSLNDLQVGQWAIYRVGEDDWTGPFRVVDPVALWHTANHPLLILADPPAPPAADWLVPADTMEALREAMPKPTPNYFAYPAAMEAARAVLDAATEVER